MKHTVSVISPLILLSLSTCFSLLKADDSDSVREGLELQLVQVVFRHGDRNPVDPYPTDPYKDESYWPEGFGQLTKIGKMQHYNLGQYFRRRYTGFLQETYSPHEILVHSSDVDRAIASAESNLAGFYPPNTPRSLWNPELKWQPIPVHSLSPSIDNIINMKAPCPRYEQLEKELLHSPDVLKVNEDNKELYTILTTYTGETVASPKDVDYVRDALFIEQTYNFTLPKWTEQIFPKYQQNMTDVAAFSFKMLTYTLEMQRLRGGPLLKTLVQNLENKTSTSADLRRKFFMYSGHDTTVAILLNVLGVFDVHCPPYAATVMVELYLNKSTNEYFIEILYRNHTDQPPLRLLIPGCASTLCPLGQFIEIAKSKIPSNWEEECKPSRHLFDVIGLVVAGLVSLLVLGLFVCLGMLIMSYLRNKRRGGPKPPVYPYLHLQMDDGDEGG